MPTRRKQRGKLKVPRRRSRTKRQRLVPDIDVSTIISRADPYDFTKSLRVECKQNVTATSMVDKLGKRLREKQLSFAPVVDKENTPSITGKPPTEQQRHGLKELINWSSNIQSQDKPPLISKLKLPNTPHPRANHKLTELVSNRHSPANTITPVRARPTIIQSANSQKSVKLPSSLLGTKTISQKAMSSRKLSIAPSCNLDLVSMELTCQTVATNKDLASSTVVQQHHHHQQTQEEAVEEMVVDDVEVVADMEHTEQPDQVMEVDDGNAQCVKDEARVFNSSPADTGLSPILLPSEAAIVQNPRGPLTSSPLEAVRGKQASTNSSNSISTLEEHFGALKMTPILPVTPLANNITPLPARPHTATITPSLKLHRCTSNSSTRHTGTNKDCTVAQATSRSAVHTHSTNTRMATAKLTPALPTQSTAISHKSADTSNERTCTPSHSTKHSDEQTSEHAHSNKDSSLHKTDRTKVMKARKILSSSSITARQSPAAKLPSRKLTSTTTAKRKSSIANCKVTSNPSQNNSTNQASYRRSLTSSHSAKASNASLQNINTPKTGNPPRIVKCAKRKRRLNPTRHTKRRKLITPNMTPARKTPTRKSSLIAKCRATRNANKYETGNTPIANSHASLQRNNSNGNVAVNTMTRNARCCVNQSVDDYPMCPLTMWSIDQSVLQLRRSHTGEHRSTHTNYSLNYRDDNIPMDILLTL